jgi:hemolysin activation/secretion protein
VTTELRTPSMKALSAFVPGLENLGDLWQLLAFTDFGDGSNHLRMPGEPADVKLWSAGPGFRYTISTNVTARADYGWQLLNQVPGTRAYASRSHLSLIVRY